MREPIHWNLFGNLNRPRPFTFVLGGMSLKFIELSRNSARVHLRMTDCSGVAICKKRLQLSETFLWGKKEILITHTCTLSSVCCTSNTHMYKWEKILIVPLSKWINHKHMLRFRHRHTPFKCRSESPQTICTRYIWIFAIN